MQRDLVRRQPAADRPLALDEDHASGQHDKPIEKAPAALHRHLLAAAA